MKSISKNKLLAWLRKLEKSFKVGSQEVLRQLLMWAGKKGVRD